MKHKALSLVMVIVLFSCKNNTKGDVKSAIIPGEEIAESTSAYDTTMFDFEPDIRLITAMSFANISGYDHENTKMTKERIEVRNYLDSVLTNVYKKKISDASKREMFAK